MIEPKTIKILKTNTSLWSNEKNGHTRIRGIIDKSGEYYGIWTNTFRSTRSFIDFLRGDIAIVNDDEDYPVMTIKYLGIHHMPTTRLGENNVPMRVWVINNRNIHYNRVGWAHVNESSDKISLSIFEGQIEHREICDGLRLVINDKYEYDVIEEITKTERKNENGDITHKSIWYSKSADKELFCVNGVFNREDLKDLFKK